MNKVQEDFFRQINNGKIYGGQKKLANKLNISEVSVSQWLAGKSQPSQDNITKMAKLFNKKEKEIKQIFEITNMPAINNGIISTGNNNINTINQISNDVELLKNRVKILELEMKLLKTKK